MTLIQVELNERSYDIEIERGALNHAGVAVASLGNVSRAVLVSDDVVDALYGERVANAILDRGVDLDEIVVPAGEDSKSIEVANSLWERLLEIGTDRRAVVVALGGGVVGDLAGFVAATYARGIRFFQIPTTLLAQVDSSVGGKTAIDLPNGKNMVGAFHQPSGVLIDPDVLRDLPREQYVSGLGEVVKYGASLDASLFETLEANVKDVDACNPDVLEQIVAQCCRIKAQIVHEDEKEISGRRALLNYGHTFGHAIETALGYGAIPHGHGVLVGSLLAAKLAMRLGRNGDDRFKKIDSEWLARQVALYQNLRLPYRLDDLSKKFAANDPDVAPERLLHIMSTDKKSEFGKLNLILPTALGECVYAKGVSQDDVRLILEEGL